jgi:hypothetical protein
MDTAVKSIYEFFKKNSDKWYQSCDIMEQLPLYSKGSVYQTISSLAKDDNVLIRRPGKNGAAEYKIKDVAPLQVTTLSNGQKGSTKVFWNDAEKQALAAEMVHLRETDKFATTKDILDRMQHVLPEHRRRKIKKSAEVSWIFDFIKKIKSKQMPETKPEITDQIARLEQKQIEREGDSYVTPVQDPLKSVSTDALFDEIGRRFASVVKAAIVGAISSEEVQNAIKLRTDINVHHTQETPTGLVKEDNRPKVVILGLRKDHQVEEVKKDFSHLKLEFAQIETPIQSVRNMIQHASELFAIVDPVNYRHANSLRDAGIKFTRIDGGIGYLRHKLTEGYQKYKFR